MAYRPGMRFDQAEFLDGIVRIPATKSPADVLRSSRRSSEELLRSQEFLEAWLLFSELKAIIVQCSNVIGSVRCTVLLLRLCQLHLPRSEWTSSRSPPYQRYESMPHPNEWTWTAISGVPILHNGGARSLLRWRNGQNSWAPSGDGGGHQTLENSLILCEAQTGPGPGKKPIRVEGPRPAPRQGFDVRPMGTAGTPAEILSLFAYEIASRHGNV